MKIQFLFYFYEEIISSGLSLMKTEVESRLRVKGGNNILKFDNFLMLVIWLHRTFFSKES